jgi:hypothetical protein
MIDSRTKLTVLHDDNSVFAEYTKQAVDYTRDPFTLSLVSAEDYLYIGYSKPFNACFVSLETANTNPNELTAEYNDGTTWVSLDLHDETNGLVRSGFITWDKTNMKSATVDSKAAYYIRIKPSADHSATTVRGLNLVFSDDSSMKTEFFEIDDASLLPSGENSHITTHVAARNMIIQQLRNQGYIKDNTTTGEANMNQWDLHDIYEIRQGAMYLGLSKIFFNLSDSVDDNWWQKYREYNDKYEEAMRLARLSFDLNDDGLESEDEQVRRAQPFRWNR